jgi:multiple sugar transport system substrate-binding protein
MKRYLVSAILILCVLFNAAAGGGSQRRATGEVNLNLTLNQTADILRDQFDAWYAHLIRRARNELGINLTIETVSWADYLNRHLMSIASGEGPDIVQLGSGAPSVVAAAGGLLDLTPYMYRFDGGFEVYFDVGQYYAMWDGKIIALPWGGGGRVTYYNKNHYRAAGLPFPQNNWTWEQFVSDATVLSRHLGRPAYGVMGTGNETTYNFWAQLITEGGTILSPDRRSSAFNSPAGVRGIRKILDLYETGLLSGSFAESTGDDLLIAFINGDLGLSYGNASWWVEVDRRMGNENYGIVTMPVGSSGLTTGAVTMSELGVMSYTRHPNEAVNMLAILSGPEETVTSTVILGWVPFRHDLVNHPAYTQHAFFETFFINAQHSRLHIPQIATVNTVLSSTTRMLNQVYTQAVMGTRFTDAELMNRLNALATEVNNMLR